MPFGGRIFSAMVRPSNFHSPGLDAKMNGQIQKILRQWAKTIGAADAKKKSQFQDRKSR